MISGWRYAPAFRSAVLLSGGILLQDVLPFEPARVLFWSLLSSALLLLLCVCRRDFFPMIGPVLCIASGLSLSAGDRLFLAPLPEKLLGEGIELEGTVLEATSRQSGVRGILDDACIRAGPGTLPVRGCVLVELAGEKQEEFRPGTRIRVGGTLYPIVGPRNPGEYDLRRWARASGLAGEVMARAPNSVAVLDSSGTGSVWARWIFPLRRALLAWIDRSVGGEEGELLKGLLIGERGGFSPGVQEDFVRAGVAHVLAVSGSNVAVVAGFFGFLLSMTGLGRAVRSLLLALVLIGYMVLSGTQPPVVRATIMAAVALTAVVLGEKVNVLNALGVSALIILAVNSQTFFDVGFQLSFAAVLSLVVVYPRFNKAISRLEGAGWWTGGVTGVLRVMAVTLAATLGTLPLTAGVFGRVSLIGLIANVVVVPLTSVSVVLGGLSALVSVLFDPIALIYSSANWGVLHFTLWFTHLCASPWWASLGMPWFQAVHTFPFLAALYTLFSLGSPSRFRRSAIVTFGLAVAAVVGVGSKAVRADARALRVTMFDVGQGDALLVGLPGGGNLLIDCGPAGPGFDAGQRTIVPFLARQGIDTLEWLVLTHEHGDHTGGLRSVLRSVCVREIGGPAPAAAALSAEVGRRVRPLAAGEAIELGRLVRCQVLSPSPAGAGGQIPQGNDGSLVLRLQYGSTVLILAGDAGAAVEDALVDRFGGMLRADCLKVAHHGSTSGTGDRFLSMVKPRTVLISVGRNNRFGHPARATLAKLRSSGAQVFRTDLGGAAVLSSEGNDLSIEK